MNRRGIGARRWRGGATLSLTLVLALLASRGAAERRTPLLEVDLRTGKQRGIDTKRPSTDADRQLDAMLGSAMGASFSTADLVRISTALQRYLRAMRPRASARLLLFLYPGRVTRSALQEMREVLVDIDLVVDPCGRTVCQDAVGTHLEVIGRALQQAELRTRRYTIRFKSVTVRAVVQIGDSEYQQYRFSATQVVQAGKRGGGGGTRLVREVEQLRAGYDKQVFQAITRQLKLRRVRIARPVEISRQRGAVTVNLAIATDRVRCESDVSSAFVAAVQGLRSHPMSPGSGSLSVVAQVPRHGLQRQVYRSNVEPWRQVIDGRLTRGQAWATYVVKPTKGGQRMTFDDRDARGGGADEGAGDDGEDRTSEILAGNFSRLAPCLQQEASRNRRFSGATLLFSVSGEGRAADLRLKERGASGRLRACLARALSGIRFGRHRGPPRRVSYPMVIQR